MAARGGGRIPGMGPPRGGGPGGPGGPNGEQKLQGSIKDKFKTMLGSLGFLLGLYKKYAFAFLILTVVFWAVYGPIAAMIQVQLASRIIGAVAEQLPLKRILITAGVLIGIQLVFSTLVTIFQNMYQQPKTTEIVQIVNREIYIKAVNTDYKYYDNPEFFADFTYAAQVLAGQLEQVRSILENSIQGFAAFAAMTAYIVMVGPWILITSIISLAVTVLIQLQQNKLNFQMSLRVLPSQRRLNYFQRMFYTIEPAADIKTTRVRDFFFRDYDDSVKKYVKELKSVFKDITFLSTLSAFARQATYFVTIALIVKSVLDGNTSDVARYSALLAASQQMQNGLTSFVFQFTQLQQISLNISRVKKFFDSESVIEPTKGDEPGDEPFALSLKDISFAYGETDTARPPKYILKGLNMDIKPGEKVAIVGENGVGKTTLMKLLLRLYDVRSGEVLVNGRSIKEYDVLALRHQIGIAFQDSQIYSLPMYENLQLYRDADESTLAEILEKVGLKKLLENEQGLNAQLTREFDDNGIMLSGGETQKFMLARLLTGRFGLLILDEPTASLDPIAEYELNKLILDRGRPETTIVVAHRLSTIRDADRIFLIDNGAVAECGSHEELMALGGKYHEMFTKQAEKYTK